MVPFFVYQYGHKYGYQVKQRPRRISDNGTEVHSRHSSYRNGSGLLFTSIYVGTFGRTMSVYRGYFWYQKILKPLRLRNILKPGQVECLFSNLEGLLICQQQVRNLFRPFDQHISFLKLFPQIQSKILELKPPSPISIAEAFLSTCDDLFPAYAKYCSTHKEALTLYEKLRSNRDFAAFLEALGEDTELRGLSLVDFLIKPIQRVTKWPLLLKVRSLSWRSVRRSCVRVSGLSANPGPLAAGTRFCHSR